MGLFKSGKSKVDDLLSILIPSLEWQMREELKKRLAVQMEDVVNEVARQVIGYGYDEAIKELTVKVRVPKPWIELSQVEIEKIVDDNTREGGMCSGLSTALEIQMRLKEKNCG
jgi:hypothetical protein